MSDVKIPQLILASSSRSRAELLASAGVPISIVPANLDEVYEKEEGQKRGSNVVEIAKVLARLKAEKVSHIYPDALVIGADQMLEIGGKWLDKPKDIEEARLALQLLRHDWHQLVTSVSIVREGKEIWQFTGRAYLKMRDYSDTFLNDYLIRVGDSVLNSVGAYQIEGRGIQLIEQIDGEYFTILGLPLLPLLKFLRDRKLISQ